jgi:hypothetical protein
LPITIADLSLTLHGWRPGGGAYDGLPPDDATASARRAERLLVTTLTDRCYAPAGMVSDWWTVDLRGGAS